jgi:hypothetical protein
MDSITVATELNLQDALHVDAVVLQVVARRD